MKQVWFTGAHANIGGGYEDNILSNLAYSWMVAEAEEVGNAKGPNPLIEFDKSQIAANTQELGKGSWGEMRDEFAGFFRMFGSIERGIGVDPTEEIHPTVKLRMDYTDTGRFIPDPPYDPPNVRNYFARRDGGGLY